ncbi:AlpA family phage regulatory protein [Leeia sp. TBRC 13508]|uniref:AlpA family phage regulatory protein n=1 Tax=Leeia speluncae TaxID=2884804 RepID=A0ABS8D450_9NEIS|nr:AlpA family phage regulatory protein [Leeia speluncae]MCB6182970.1 AlpA family phage regulatory protein [Leeia speluncae]
MSNTPIQIIRRPAVETMTGLSRATIYDKLNTKSPRHDPSFPKQINLGADAVGWLKHEVEAWILARVEQSRKAA